ncbi:TraB/GumN family protein [Paraburkholderia pallida]|nr:TraB/GumN family protein [Paraburkholderia pallida]
MISAESISETLRRAMRNERLGHIVLTCAAAGLLAATAMASASGATNAPAHETAPVATDRAAHAQSHIQASAPDDRPPVWTASAPGHPTLLLLPTLHGLASDDPRVDAALAALAQRVQAIVLEAHTQPTPEDAQTIRRIGFYPASDNLSNHMHSMTAESLARCARESGADIHVFFQTKPWLAGFSVEAVRLHQWHWQRKAGATRLHFVKSSAPLVFRGIDERLETIARRGMIPLIYLETMEQAMRLFDDMPSDDQEAFLQGVCAGLHGQSPGEVSYEALQTAWAAGDVATLERLAMMRFPGESAAHYDFSQYLFVRGTEIFSATMAKDGYFYGKGPILVAVGAGHFFGPQSLLQRLHEAGYTITPPAQPLVPVLPTEQHEVAAR